MVSSVHESENSVPQPDPEPWANTPNAWRNVLVEIADLTGENQALHARADSLFSRLKEVCSRRGLPPPTLEDIR